VNNENEREHSGGRRELLEKTIAKILHRHCNFGWANYYIPSEKFPSLIEELVEVMSPAARPATTNWCSFSWRQRLPSIQERVAKTRAGIFGVQRG